MTGIVLHHQKIKQIMVMKKFSSTFLVFFIFTVCVADESPLDRQFPEYSQEHLKEAKDRKVIWKKVPNKNQSQTIVSVLITEVEDANKM